MTIIIRFSDIPEDLIFEVKSRTEYANAVYQAWQYVRGEVEGLKCFVECPDNLPQEWATVPDLMVPPYWGGLVDIYRQWPRIVECFERLSDLSEIVDDGRFISGSMDAPESQGVPCNAVVIPFIKTIKYTLFD